MNKGISAPGTGILLALPRLVLRSPLILLYARRRRADGRQGLGGGARSPLKIKKTGAAEVAAGNGSPPPPSGRRVRLSSDSSI